MASATRNTIIYLLKLYRRYYLPIFFISLFVAVTQSLVVATLLPVFNLFLGVTKVAPASCVFSFIDRAIRAMPFSDQISAAFMLLIILAVLQSAAELLNEFLISYASGTIMYDIKDRLMRWYSRSPYQYFLDTKQGEIIYNTLMAPSQIAQVLLRIPQVFVEIAKIAGIVAVLVFLNPYLTVAVIVLGVAFSVVIGYLSKRYTYKFAREKVEATTAQNVIFNEFINGVKQIFVYGVKNRWIDDFNKMNRKIKNFYIKSNTWFFAPNNLLQLFAFLTIFAVIIVVKAYYPDKLFSSLPIVGFYAAALIKLLPSVNNLGRRRMEMVDALPDSERVLGILRSGGSEEKTKGEKIFLGLKNSIAFRDVYFSHKGRKDLLRGINIVFRKNKITAVVGDSGSGKTTLINLLLRLFNPTSGRIEIDGADIRKYDLRSWLDRIGFVSQDAFIYHSTIKDNITFGSKDYHMEDVMKASRLANAHDFIAEFPDGYETIVGERGLKLSGGQQQRIAIARAILRSPDIIILDEATSALDNISEKAVQNAINAVSKDRTVIIVAHRLSTIQNADDIVFLKNGVIAEEGSHTELIKRDGFYRNMYTEQDQLR